jgi:hypothetical protein
MRFGTTFGSWAVDRLAAHGVIVSHQTVRLQAEKLHRHFAEEQETIP